MNEFGEQLRKEEQWRKDNVITQKLNPKYNYEELKTQAPKEKAIETPATKIDVPNSGWTKTQMGKENKVPVIGLVTKPLP